MKNGKKAAGETRSDMLTCIVTCRRYSMPGEFSHIPDDSSHQTWPGLQLAQGNYLSSPQRRGGERFLKYTGHVVPSLPISSKKFSMLQRQQKVYNKYNKWIASNRLKLIIFPRVQRREQQPPN